MVQIDEHAAMFDAMKRALDVAKDQGTSIDTGSGMGSRDFWVTIAGIEYFVTVRESEASLKRRLVPR